MFVNCRRVSARASLIVLVTLIAGVLAAPAAWSQGRSGWLASGSDPVGLDRAISAHGQKLPAEFSDRLRHERDGLLRVMVSVTDRSETVEAFVDDSTTWVKWYFDNPRFYAGVTADEFQSLLESPTIRFIEPDVPLTYFNAESTIDVGARSLEANGAGVWSFDPEAGPLGALTSNIEGLTADQATGKGITVAITDSGIDRTFRDFGGWDCEPGPYQPCESRIVRAVTTEHVIGGPDLGDLLPTTEAASGHGSHVAGTVAGNGYYGRDGSADDATYGADGIPFGVAPQANLIMTKNGDTIWAGMSQFGLEWQLENADTYGIRVSSNSWGCLGGCSFNGSSATGQLFKNMYEAGIVVTFAAGNDGGTDNGTRFSGYAQSPYVLGVASYDDESHKLASSSSRGSDKTLPDPNTWTPESEPVNGERRPDVAAPGVGIWSARTLTGGVASGVPRQNTADVIGGGGCCIRNYAIMSGTSMATPHVAGAAALAFSACPSATPLDVMRAVMATAGDDILTSDGSRIAEPWEAGYGGLQVRAAVDWLLARQCDSNNSDGSDGGDGDGGGGDEDPDGCPTTAAAAAETTSTATGEGRTYYLHSLTGLGNGDWATGGSTFDAEQPTFTGAATFHDIPGVWNAAATQPWDPSWTGTVEDHITGLTLDFWAKTPVGDLLGQVRYNPSIWVGDLEYALPTLTQEIEPQIGNAPSRITATYTTMLDADGNEIPLSIDPAGQPVTLTIAGRFIDEEAGSWIVYDSTTYPSSFTVTSAVEPAATAISFTENSATSGQYTDKAVVEAKLVEAATGAPIAGAEVEFELACEDRTTQMTDTTDETGLASVALVLNQPPGPYNLTVRYAGDETYAASAETGSFLVAKEDSVTTLVIEGVGGNGRRTATATLVDADDDSFGIAGQMIEFFAEGESIGMAETDADGNATVAVPNRYAGGSWAFEAVFTGNDFFEGSRAETRS